MPSPALRRQLIALSVAFLVHALFLGLLYLLRLEGAQRPPQTEELVLMDLGNVAEAGGTEEPLGMQQSGPEPDALPAPEPTPPRATPTPTSPAPVSTQTHEESLRQRRADEEARRQREAARQERERRREEAERLEAQRRREEAEAQRRAEQRRQVGSSVAGAFGAGRSAGANHGNAAGSGNQGDPAGVPGGSFSLSGRHITSNGGQLTPPRTHQAIEGRIVVAIEVDHRGQVTAASISPRGTNIADPTTRAEALSAARSTTFNAQEGAESQRGTITYIYVIKR